MIYIEHGKFTRPLPNGFNKFYGIVSNYNMFLYNKNRFLKNPAVHIVHGSTNALKYLLYTTVGECTICLDEPCDLSRDLKAVSESGCTFTEILVSNTTENMEVIKRFNCFLSVSKIDTDHIYLVQKSSESESS